MCNNYFHSLLLFSSILPCFSYITCEIFVSCILPPLHVSMIVLEFSLRDPRKCQESNGGRMDFGAE